MIPLEDNFRQNLNSIRLLRLGSPPFRHFSFQKNFTVLKKFSGILISEISINFENVKNFGEKF